VNNERLPARPGRKAQVDPMEGVLVRSDAVALNRRRSPAGLARWSSAHSARSARGARRGAAKEAARSGLPCDRGRQRFARPVRLPQPMGAGGRAADEGHPRVISVSRRGEAS